MAETRLLEAKLEAMKHRSPVRDKPMSPRPSDVPPDYLEMEQRLERQLDSIMEEMETIKDEVEGLTKQAQNLTTPDLSCDRSSL